MPNAGDRVKATDYPTTYTTARPLIRLVANATQSIPHNVATALSWPAGTEDFDTAGYHDTTTNTSRITPLLAGYWAFDGTVLFGARADYTNINAWIRVNAATNLAPAWRMEPAALSQTSTCRGYAEVLMNGTTDYIELMAQHANSAAAAQVTNQSSQFSSALHGRFLRPA